MDSRPVTSVHQIELSTHCNLACRYCPSPVLPRVKEHMAMDTYRAALDHVRHYERLGTQGELSLTGIGEALLHPEIIECVALARETITGPLVLATNGLALTEDLCRALAPYGVQLYVSLHRPEKAGPAVELAKRHGLLAAVNASAATSAFDWAGQVEWFVSAPPTVCEYLRTGWAVVLADGHVTTCCLDASGAGCIGSVFDEPGAWQVAPYDLCSICHMTVPA